ncbi:hypothetical protein PG995_013299 [Apiospora arundinis]|uniref:Uncharacterized protein n=1 Tax=Apiospora arundinis TaxID=335852 RepID=A0ABR2I3J0_9PEZI
MVETLLEAASLPLGTKAVDMPVLEFDFLQAIELFQEDLPGDYRDNPWLEELKKQCLILSIRYKRKVLSLLYLQVDFLTCVYRGVYGGLAAQSGWEKMKAELSTEKNGSADHLVNGQLLFERAMSMSNARQVITYIAQGGRLSLNTFIITTPVTVGAVAEPSSDTWLPGYQPKCFQTFNLAAALREIKKKGRFDDHTWFHDILKETCRYQALKKREWNSQEGKESLYYCLIKFVYEVYEQINDIFDDSENPWYDNAMESDALNSIDDVFVDRRHLFTTAMDMADEKSLILYLVEGPHRPHGSRDGVMTLAHCHKRGF